jgi:hypothetical protein
MGSARGPSNKTGNSMRKLGRFPNRGIPWTGVQGKTHRDITLRWEPNGSGIGLLILDNREGSSSLDVPSLWEFSTKPFRADLDIHHTMVAARVNYDARLTLRLTHTPH